MAENFEGLQPVEEGAIIAATWGGEDRFGTVADAARWVYERQYEKWELKLPIEDAFQLAWTLEDEEADILVSNGPMKGLVKSGLDQIEGASLMSTSTRDGRIVEFGVVFEEPTPGFTDLVAFDFRLPDVTYISASLTTGNRLEVEEIAAGVSDIYKRSAGVLIEILTG